MTINCAQVPPYYPDNIISQTDWANYYKSVEALDGDIGKVLEQLKAHNFHENIIIIFMGYHGRPMTRGKTWLYDSGIKIPFFYKNTRPCKYYFNLSEIG